MSGYFVRLKGTVIVDTENLLSERSFHEGRDVILIVFQCSVFKGCDPVKTERMRWTAFGTDFTESSVEHNKSL